MPKNLFLKFSYLSVGLFAFGISSLCQAQLCDSSNQYCGWVSGSKRASRSNPSTGGRVSINPSAVPVEKGYGLEVIDYQNSFDFVVVKGFGRVGAAISPSNSEETFFGPPGVELPEDYLVRRQNGIKFPSQKTTLATALTLFNNKRTDLKRVELNLGLMGKYNRLTKSASPGGGLSGVFGPFTTSYSLYKDETQLDLSNYGLAANTIFYYTVDTFSLGMYFGWLAVDYSVMHLTPTKISTGPALSTKDVPVISMVTGTLILKKLMLTFSKRTEKSLRPAYDYKLKVLVDQEIKEEFFGGAQLSLNSHIMIGAYYNYYLLREVSAALTVFL